MKKLSVQALKSVAFSLIVFLSLFLLQCKNETDQADITKNVSSGFTKIAGYIHNRDAYPNTKDITINVSHISGEDRVTQIKSPINDDGTFYFEIDLARPQDVTMQPFLDFLYLVPGDSLHIELDFKKPLEAQLSGGKSVEINNDFYKYFYATGYRTTYFNYRGVGTDCEINCTWEEIRKKMDEERDFYRDKRQTFLQKNQVCDEVVFLTEAMIELDYYKSFVGTWGNRKYWGKEIMEQQTLMNEVNEVAVKYFNAGLYSNTHFKFIESAYMRVARHVTQPSADVDFVDWAKEVAKTDVIKDFLLTVQAGNALLQKNLDDFEKYSKHVNHEYLLDRLMQEYKIVRTNMLNPENISSYILGNPKDFTSNISLEDKNVLAKSISPNYGKVQIINICASWCSPCKVVMEQLAALEKEYADKNVCFNFICITPDNKETRAMYREKGVDDTKVYFTTKDEYLFLANTFSPMSFPYGILVNKKGIIVDYGWHVRPDMMLREKIDLLLVQDKLIK